MSWRSRFNWSIATAANGVRPPPQAGDSPHPGVRTVPDGRNDAGAHSLRNHGTPAGEGDAGSQWAYARLRPAEVAVGLTSPGYPPKALEDAFEIGYAARRAEIELLKGGQSIDVSGATSVTAEADRTYLVRGQWGRWVNISSANGRLMSIAWLIARGSEGDMSMTVKGCEPRQA